MNGRTYTGGRATERMRARVEAKRRAQRKAAGLPRPMEMTPDARAEGCRCQPGKRFGKWRRNGCPVHVYTPDPLARADYAGRVQELVEGVASQQAMDDPSYVAPLQELVSDLRGIAPPPAVQRVRATRCSALPILQQCPESHAHGMRVDEESEPAAIGTAVHSIVSAFIRTGRMPAAAEACRNAGAESEEEVADLGGWAVHQWLALADAFPDPSVELSMGAMLDADLGNGAPPLQLDGTADVLSIVGDTVRVLDWKTGRKQRDYMAQVKGYALLACRHAGTRRASVTVVYVRDRWRETIELEWDDLLAFERDIRAQAARAGREEYRLGEGCAHCPRAAECPARSAMIRSAARDLVSWGEMPDALTNQLPDLLRGLAADNRMSALYTALSCVERMADVLRSGIRAQVEAGGALVQPDGWALSMVETKRRQVDTLRAWPVLRQLVPDETQLASAVSVRLTRVEEIVSEAAPRGQKSKAIRAALRMLDDVGAVQVSRGYRLTQTTADKLGLPPAAAADPPDRDR